MAIEAPTGFPSRAALREALLKLHARFNVVGDIENCWRVGSEAADRWRVMMKDLVEFKKRKTTVTATSSTTS